MRFAWRCKRLPRAQVTSTGYRRTPGSRCRLLACPRSSCDERLLERRIQTMKARLAITLIVSLTAVSLFPAQAAASCIRTTPAEQRARADVIFDGVALDR